jgi:(p)ppGpp synthase/HD superfamily hydrolase
MKFNTLADAIALAEFAHRNQLDKAGLPYIEHPKRVMASVRAMGVNPYVQAAAVLHDVLEDTPFTDTMLIRLGVSEPTVRLVALVSRNYELVNEDCIPVIGKGNPEVYYARIAANPDARLIKLADITDNLLPWRLSYFDTRTQDRLKKKYHEALKLIGAV